MNHDPREEQAEGIADWWAFILSVALLIAIGVLVLGCGEKPCPGRATEETREQPAAITEILEQNEALAEENADLTQAVFYYKLAQKIQSGYAKRGENKSFKLVRETIVQAFSVAQFYEDQLPETLNQETFAFYLLAFASKETDFNPLLEGKHGDSGICQTLKKDYKRLIKKARAREIEFKDDIKSVRTGLICCAEEYLEKLEIAHGNAREAVWRYNGNKDYLAAWNQRYREIRYNE